MVSFCCCSCLHGLKFVGISFHIIDLLVRNSVLCCFSSCRKCLEHGLLPVDVSCLPVTSQEHAHICVSVFASISNLNCNSGLWGYHGGDYEGCRLLGYKNPVRTSQETHYISATEQGRLILCRNWGFTAVTMKNGVFWDVTPCGSCKNRSLGGT
jgi:hypothetical protein